MISLRRMARLCCLQKQERNSILVATGKLKISFHLSELMNKSHQVAHISLEIWERDLILNNVIVNQSLGVFVNCSWLTINNFFLN